MEEEGVKTLLAWSYYYLKFRARTEAEMRVYLVKKADKYGFSSELVDKALIRLKELSLLNDKSFIKEYVSSMQRSKPMGEYALRHKLNEKGVSEDDINSFFQSEDPLLSQQKNEEIIKKVLIKAAKKYQHESSFEKRKKTIEFLRRRGFIYSDILKAIEETEGGEYN